ncbi:MAG: prepilin peptidase [Pseudomonadota bacterium]
MLVLLTCLALALCAYAALNDVATLKIPNWLNVSLVTLGLSALFVAGLGFEATIWHLTVALLAFVVSFALFVAGVWGGGDAKMVPAVLLWIGPLGVMPFLQWMVVAGGILAAVLIVARRTVPAGYRPRFLRKSLEKGAGAPYGVAIAAGVFMAVPSSPVFAELVSVFSASH